MVQFSDGWALALATVLVPSFENQTIGNSANMFLPVITINLHYTAASPTLQNLNANLQKVGYSNAFGICMFHIQAPTVCGFSF